MLALVACLALLVMVGLACCSSSLQKISHFNHATCSRQPYFACVDGGQPDAEFCVCCQICRCLRGFVILAKRFDWTSSLLFIDKLLAGTNFVAVGHLARFLVQVVESTERHVDIEAQARSDSFQKTISTGKTRGNSELHQVLPRLDRIQGSLVGELEEVAPFRFECAPSKMAWFHIFKSHFNVGQVQSTLHAVQRRLGIEAIFSCGGSGGLQLYQIAPAWTPKQFLFLPRNHTQ